MDKPAGKPTTNRRLARRERKLALIQDVDKLKKKLRQEENVHRALERAFSRPLGALPRLPPYLPPQTLELLAEVAVLEEEVVRLEEEVVNFRQGLYQEAVYLSSRINNENSSNNSMEQSLVATRSATQDASTSSMTPVKVNVEPSKLPKAQPLNSLSGSNSYRIPNDSSKASGKGADFKKHKSSMEDDGLLGKENRTTSNSNEKVKDSPVRNSVKRPPIKPENVAKQDPPKLQKRSVDQERPQESSCGSSSGDRILEANKVSEDVLKCLFGIFLRLSKLKAKTMDAEAFSNLVSLAFNTTNRGAESKDPYGICLKSKKRDIGPYKNLFAIEAGSIDLKKKTNASLLIRRLKFLLAQLSSVSLEGFTHQQKLAFWINSYNICMMNGFLEHGIPENPEMMVKQLQKATVTIGGHSLNAATIENFILRLPRRLKHSCQESPNKDEIEIRNEFGLEWSEPLVTFALCCGSWSSPAVRVYTAAQVENELEMAKREYLQAAVGISKSNKIIIPNMLDWYLLDFAKDLEAFMDWVCLQLPDELRKEAVLCIEKRRREPFPKLVQVMHYDYRFRYLISR